MREAIEVLLDYVSDNNIELPVVLLADLRHAVGRCITCGGSSRVQGDCPHCNPTYPLGV